MPSNVEGVAEGEHEGLLLRALANRDIGTTRSGNVVDHTVVDEILRELFETGAVRTPVRLPNQPCTRRIVIE